MEDKIDIGEPKEFQEYDVRDEEGTVIQCLLKNGDECVGPILETKIKGYKFECHYNDCEEEFTGLSKEVVIDKAKSHMISHSDYY